MTINNRRFITFIGGFIGVFLGIGMSRQLNFVPLPIILVMTLVLLCPLAVWDIPYGFTGTVSGIVFGFLIWQHYGLPTLTASAVAGVLASGIAEAAWRFIRFLDFLAQKQQQS